MEGNPMFVYVALSLFVIMTIYWKIVQKEKRKLQYKKYLKSDDWKRKRYVVLKRDNWTCQECGVPATQVHHKKYAKYQIGKEPIKWLVSLSAECHKKKH